MNRGERPSWISHREPPEHAVDGVTGLVITVRPKMTVRVQRLDRRLVTESILYGLDRATSGDEQRRLEVPKIVEGRPVG